VVIPGGGGLVSAGGGYGHGSVPAGGSPVGGHGIPGGGSSPAPAPGKGKQERVTLDDDEVSSNEDEPLQKQPRQLSGAAGPSRSRPATIAPDAVAAATAAADKEAADKRATEEVAVAKAIDKEAVKKVAADKEAADKRTAVEAIVKGAAAGATEDSPAPGQAPSLVAGTKRVVAPPRRPNDPTGAFGNLGIFSLFSLGFILSISHFHTAPLPLVQSPRWAPLLLP
jgi:hypothetical protein